MIVNQLFQPFLKTTPLTTSTKLEVKEDQLLFGKVTKLYPQQTAEVQVGNQKLIAHLSVPLTLQEHYWFQVKNRNGSLQLKVLTEINQKNEKNEVQALLHSLNLRETNEHKIILQYLKANNQPITKDIIMFANKWISEKQDPIRELEVIKHMLKQELPLTDAVFLSLSALNTNKSISGILRELQQLLSNFSMENQNPELLKQIQLIIEPPSIGENTTQTIDTLKGIFKHLGYSHEFQVANEPITGTQIENLKAQLLDLASKEIPSPVRETTNLLVDKLTGYQLLSYQQGVMTSYLLELPIRILQETVDVTMQYNGRKLDNGKVDSNYCRIIFYLELAKLKEIIVDMNVQNRIMNITIYNDYEHLPSLIERFSPVLKKRMETADYQLLSISAKKRTDKKTNGEMNIYAKRALTVEAYRGVDFKI